MRHMSRASHDENADMTLVIPMGSRCLRRLELARLLCMTVWGNYLFHGTHKSGGMRRMKESGVSGRNPDRVWW